MRIRALILGLALCGAALGQETLAPAQRAELGVRWWASSAETLISINSQVVNPTFGNPTSVLVYENLDANTFELFGRQPFGNGAFVKGIIGFGSLNVGVFEDEDFRAGQVKFADTTSSVPTGRIGYGVLDLGSQVYAEGAATLGVFAGFSQWTETYEAYGATDNLGTIGGNISTDVLVITNKVRWRALRVGLAGDFRLGRRARLTLDLAAVPYAQMRNEDSHHLRAQPVGSSPSALGPVPNIIEEGDAWGVQLDAALRYELAPRTHLEVGARYWYLEVREGTTNFRNVPGAEVPIVDFYTQRFGITFSLLRTW